MGKKLKRRRKGHNVSLKVAPKKKRGKVAAPVPEEGHPEAKEQLASHLIRTALAKRST